MFFLDVERIVKVTINVFRTYRYIHKVIHIILVLFKSIKSLKRMFHHVQSFLWPIRWITFYVLCCCCCYCLPLNLNHLTESLAFRAVKRLRNWIFIFLYFARRFRSHTKRSRLSAATLVFFSSDFVAMSVRKSYRTHWYESQIFVISISKRKCQIEKNLFNGERNELF